MDGEILAAKPFECSMSVVHDQWQPPSPPDECEGKGIRDGGDDRAADHRPHDVGHQQRPQQRDQLTPELMASQRQLKQRDQAMFKVARNLAASPIVLTDDDCTEAMKYTGPREVVQLVIYTTILSSFNRITEAAGLQLEQ